MIVNTSHSTMQFPATMKSKRLFYLQRLREFSHEMTNSVDLAEILRILRENINGSLLPDRIHIFLFDRLSNQYVAAAGEDGLPTSEVRFPKACALVQTLVSAEMPVFSDDDSLLSESLPEMADLVSLGAQVYVLLPGNSRPIGWLALGKRHSREAYTPQSLDFLIQIGNAAAIAISNAQLYREVQAADEAKSEFVSFVAHELKNPMTSIMGYTDLLSKGSAGPVTEMQASFLRTIHSNVERMSTLVSELTDHSKIEANRLRLDFNAVDTVEVVDEVIRSTKRQLDDKKQAGRVKLPDKMPKVWADRTRLVQVLTNLVSNANKYTPEGGTITIGAEKSANRWDPSGATHVVHMWVQDNGIGVTLEDQAKIFQKFFRSDDSKAQDAPGTGLGLSIAKSLIEMMGGLIWIESEFRQGATFHFTIPVADTERR
jgi:signal transduction histidine kinase